MSRELTLRQIEGFKAVVETGTISIAAVRLGISQPAMSKLIMHLEEDAGLILFDRSRRRLALTAHGTRFYEEIDRIFAGVRQVQKVADAIRREKEGQLTIGVMPALSNAFVRRAVSNFTKNRPRVMCSIFSHTSDRIAELLATHQLDIGLVHGLIENRYILPELLLQHPLVCIMPKGHRLERHKTVAPEDLNGLPFISPTSDGYTGKLIAMMMQAHKVQVDQVIASNNVSMICEFVADGAGVSLVHPLFASGFEQRLAIRPFEPETPYHFQICRSRENRNADLVREFLQVMRQTAVETLEAMGIPAYHTDATPKHPGDERTRAISGMKDAAPVAIKSESQG